MQLVNVGYNAKRLTARPDWLAAPQVQQICSVSTCIAEDPDRRLCDWDLNSFGLFNSPEEAWRVVPAEEQERFGIYAYRLLPIEFDEGTGITLSIAWDSAVPIPVTYRSLGFDAVSRSGSTFFECSPLSCNSGASEMMTNEYCLFPTLEAAVEGAQIFSRGNWEPGPYFVLEVLSDLPIPRAG